MKRIQRFKSTLERHHSSLKRRWLALSDPEDTKRKHKDDQPMKTKETTKSSPNTFDKSGFTPLHYAAQNGDAGRLEELIEYGGEVELASTEFSGCTPPIVFAAMNGHAQCVQVLLMAGADPNQTDQWGNSALFKAASYNYIECVKLLLKHGASPSLANKWGAVPIQIASLQGYMKVVTLLLEHGADIKTDQCGTFGDTSLPHPIVAATTKCHIDCLKMLLQSEPNIDASQLESALTMALYYFLCSCAGYKYTPSNATVTERFECLKLLVVNGARITSEHVKMTCYHHFIPVLNLKAYVAMLKFILRATTYNPRDANWEHTMMVIFGHVTRLGKYKWELIQLICSIGFTPNRDLLDGLAFTLTDAEMDHLQNLRTTPRSLTDLCRQSVRQHTASNVPYMLNHLNIPPLLKHVILVKELRIEKC